MKIALKYLKSKREEIVERLKNGEQKYLLDLQSIDRSIYWLEKLNTLNITNVKKYDIIEIPDSKTRFSTYRIINDCDTDDRNYWIELTNGNYPIELSMGDFLLVRKTIER